ACQGTLAQVMYRIQPLGTLNGCDPEVLAFNDADQATGDICAPHSTYHAFVWKHDGTPLVDLGPLEAGSISQGTSINASGVVTGYAQDSTGEFAFLSSGDGTPMKRIYDTFGGNQLDATAINDRAQLTGAASTASDLYHAFVWKNDGSMPVDLGTLGGDMSVGIDINASGQVAGYADLPGSATHHAFIWKNDRTPIHDLGTLGGPSSQALFINASGQVAGTSTVPGRATNYHAVFWRNDGTPMQDLGTLGGTSSLPVALNDAGQVAGTSFNQREATAFVWLNNGTRIKKLGDLGGGGSYANDLNASGQVTGRAILANTRSHAFLWRNDGTKMQDLNKLLDPRDPLKRYVTLTWGQFINDHGNIIAIGEDARTGRASYYLLHGTVLKLSPRSLAFGNQPINTSAAKAVTVTNTGSEVVPFTGTALTGPAHGQYTATDNCGASLAGHASCIIQVNFRPTTKGAKYGFLKVNGGEGGLLLVHLAGTGT
ncbi:MAG: choice-of-anchor D domain-containing protein, partial [Bryobacteraceae bacterium]